MSLSVIGAGFGRTGTLSLKHALERIGFGPCYHMLEVLRNPEHVAFWDEIADGARDRWEDVFAAYTATVDWPACRYWRELAERYPEARVLLSVRDADAWYDSVHATIYAFMVQGSMGGDPATAPLQAMARKTVLQRTFDGRFEDRRHAISVYERHNEAVRAAFPEDRLLVFRPGEGWEPLCRFLGVPAPDEPFPHVNSREELRRQGGLSG
jgi:hypothetical protein